ncbi:MAG: hypothetical protein MJ123_10160 [Lachnospiraceae bacterium]|nr:hypothetical protein [Lachnospiraceae bacterium]
MAKKFGKRLLGLAVVGAAAAGVYYYLKKENEIPVNLEDEDEDLDNFDDTLEEEGKNKRAYVNLDFETVENKAKEVAEKAGEFVKKSADTFESFVSQAGTKVEEFFDDKKSTEVTENAEAEVETENTEEACEETEE